MRLPATNRKRKKQQLSVWAYSSKGDSTIYRSVTNRNIKNALKTYSGVSNPTQYCSDKHLYSLLKSQEKIELVNYHIL